MINSFYSGVSGAKGFQNELNVTANNIANVNTTAYKSQEACFADLIYTNMAAQEENATLVSGNGVKIASVTSLLQTGPLTETGRNLDAAIMGDGYFAVRDAAGEVYFTRNGNFQLQTISGQMCLTTAGGDCVLNEEMEPATIANPNESIFLTGPGGEISQEAAGEDNSIHIGVFSFSNPYALLNDGYGRMKATDGSGTGDLVAGAKIRTGVLEGSNVDVATELCNMLQAQRGFQFSAKLIQTADELENVANNLR